MTGARLAPRKPPLQARARTTVAAILEAAARILEERGLDGYNTNAVAERAGVSIGSLYQYFPNKDALTAALSREARARLLAAIEQTIEATDGADLETILRALVRVTVAQQMTRPVLARLLDAEEARLPLGEDAAALALAIRAKVEAVLARAGTGLSDELLPVIAEDLLHITRGMIDGAAQSGETQIASLEDRVSLCLAAYVRAAARLSASPPRSPD